MTDKDIYAFPIVSVVKIKGVYFPFVALVTNTDSILFLYNENSPVKSNQVPEWMVYEPFSELYNENYNIDELNILVDSCYYSLSSYKLLKRWDRGTLYSDCVKKEFIRGNEIGKHIAVIKSDLTKRVDKLMNGQADSRDFLGMESAVQEIFAKDVLSKLYSK